MGGREEVEGEEIILFDVFWDGFNIESIVFFIFDIGRNWEEKI